MSEQIFRKKSLERISSPEQLDDYLKVSTPSLWLVLVAVVSILVGILVWASVSNLETTISAVGEINNQKVEIVLTGSDVDRIDAGMEVRIGTYTTTIEQVEFDDLGRAIAICNADITDGNYRVEIVTESIHPITFLFR